MQHPTGETANESKIQYWQKTSKSHGRPVGYGPVWFDPNAKIANVPSLKQMKAKYHVKYDSDKRVCHHQARWKAVHLH